MPKVNTSTLRKPAHWIWVSGVILIACAIGMGLAQQHMVRRDVENLQNMIVKADSLSSADDKTEAMDLYIQIADNFYHALGDKGLIAAGSALNSLGYILISQYDDNTNASNCFNSALTTAYSLCSPLAQCSMHYNIGNFYFHYNDFYSAQSNYSKGLDLASDLENPSLAGLAMNQILACAIEGENFDWAANAWLRYEESPDDIFLPYNLALYKSITYATKQNWTSAVGEVQKARSYLSTDSVAQKAGRFFENSKSADAVTAIKEHLLQTNMFVSQFLLLADECRQSADELYALIEGRDSISDARFIGRVCGKIQTVAQKCEDSDLALEASEIKRTIDDRFADKRKNKSYQKIIEKLDSRQTLDYKDKSQYETLRSLIYISWMTGIAFIMLYLWRRRKYLIQAARIEPKYKGSIYNAPIWERYKCISIFRSI